MMSRDNGKLTYWHFAHFKYIVDVFLCDSGCYAELANSSISQVASAKKKKKKKKKKRGMIERTVQF